MFSYGHTACWGSGEAMGNVLYEGEVSGLLMVEVDGAGGTESISDDNFTEEQRSSFKTTKGYYVVQAQ